MKETLVMADGMNKERGNVCIRRGEGFFSMVSSLREEGFRDYGQIDRYAYPSICTPPPLKKKKVNK